MALENIAKRLHIEPSTAVLNALGNHVPYPLESEYIEMMLLSQDRFSLSQMLMANRADYTHSTAVLVRNFDANPESLQDIARRELQNADDQVRLRLCGALELIQQQRPSDDLEPT